MKSIRAIWLGLRTLKQRLSLKREIDEELRFHLEQRAAENIAGGMSPGEAARDAQKRFGNLQSVREECRDARGASFGEMTKQDICFGLRTLRKAPGFTIVVMLMLALGIGANTAIFSVVNAVLLRPLPYPRPDRIVQVWTERKFGSGAYLRPSWPDFEDFQASSSSFANLAHYKLANFHFTGTTEPAEVQTARVSTGFFDVLGVPPFLGRPFLSNEDIPGKDQVVLLGYGLWNRRFAGDTNIVGRTIGLDGKSFVVCGIMPPGFHFPETAEIWVPYGIHSDHVNLKRDDYFDLAIGRLRDGVSLPQAQAELAGIAARLEKQYPITNQGMGARLVPLAEELASDSKPALMILLGAVGVVLLIACANAANLQLARGLARQKEIAVRVALGAGRLRIIRQLLTESLLLSLGGGLIGLCAAYGVMALLIHIAPANLPRLNETRLDGSVLIVCLCLSLATGILFGLFPAIYASRLDVGRQMKDDIGAAQGTKRQLARSVLVTGQIALSVVLLIAAALLLMSLEKLDRVSVGFNPRNLILTRITLPWNPYHLSGKDRVFFRELSERIRLLPGAENSALTCAPPLADTASRVWVNRAGDTMPPGKEWTAYFDYVTPSYLDVLQIPLLRGRNLNDRDTAHSPRVVVIDESFARRYFPNADPIGQPLLVEAQGSEPFSVIGIAGGARYHNLADPPFPHLYLSYQQINEAKMWLVVRSRSPLPGFEKTVAREVQAIDPDQSIGPMRTMDEYIAQSSQLQRFRTFLLTLFASLALILSVAGVYSVMAWTVVQRTRELGLRVALGATPGDIFLLIVGQGCKLAVVGVLLGVGIAFLVTRVLANMLYEVTQTDPIAFLVIPILLFAAVLLACYLPARRAARIDPMTALRYE